ncbi:hypothetical protein GGX14DRAFT_642739 [Mycena pura]|uniref:Uncharacterized protein n=1 Tax=Mycena pura TaxID=153505 RepID=A0AAD6YQB3_9AGAR|nr:hypothetical protein GGX14DRAFT_642739 [Mycena pura]
MWAEPRLPVDLERTIFEVSADGDRPTMLRIILVARRCRAWIEPLLYHSVVICQSGWSLPLLMRTIESNPARFAQWIKTIQINSYITLNDPAVNRILSLCTGVVRLVDLSYGRMLYSALCRLRLERMCISLDIIDGLPPDGAYFRHPAFAKLTHLHVLDPPQSWPHVPFADLPSLTHLALRNYRTQINPRNVPVLQKLLSSCPLLESLVVYVLPSWSEDQNAQTMRCLVDDPRFKILCQTLDFSDDLWLPPAVELCHNKQLDSALWRSCDCLRAKRATTGYQKVTVEL